VTYIIDAGTEVKEGDVLVRLDTKRVEDAISKHTTESHTARATLEESIANLNQRLLAEAAYLEGEYKTRLQRLERQLKVARTNLETAETHLANSRSMFNRGFVTLLEVESNEFTSRGPNWSWRSLKRIYGSWKNTPAICVWKPFAGS
jgi:multidrug resistance efflux pump